MTAIERVGGVLEKVGGVRGGGGLAQNDQFFCRSLKAWSLGPTKNCILGGWFGLKEAGLGTKSTSLL